MRDFAGDPFVFACYVAALAASSAIAFFSHHRELQYAVRLVLISWVLTKLWRMAFPHFTGGYLIIDLAMLIEFARLWRSTRLKLFRDLIAIYACFPIWHAASMALDFSGPFLGATRSDQWIQAFWRNRLFDIGLARLWVAGAGQIWLIHNPAARARTLAEIERLEKSLKRLAARVLLRRSPPIFPPRRK